MSKETTRAKFPYPENTDTPTGPAQIKALADRLEALTPLTGFITGAGAITLGTGFTVEKVATGHYKITFTVEMPSTVIPVATVLGTGKTRTATINEGADKNQFRVFTWEEGVATDRTFYFIAMPAL